MKKHDDVTGNILGKTKEDLTGIDSELRELLSAEISQGFANFFQLLGSAGLLGGDEEIAKVALRAAEEEDQKILGNKQ